MSNYPGHNTTKYNDLYVKDTYVCMGLKHTILGCHTKNPLYVLREDGEVFRLHDNGEMHKMAQFYAESGGVKNRARREAGKGGGSVYKTINLYGHRFLTHKLLEKYVTFDNSRAIYYNADGTKDCIMTKKDKYVDHKFYKGRMPDGVTKRCYRAV